MKVCTKCHESKTLGEFVKDKRRKLGLGSVCIECEKLRFKIYRIKNRDVLKLKSKKYYSENKEKCDIAIKNWELRNPDKKRKHSLSSYYRHHEKKKSLAREYKKVNSLRIKTYMKTWRKENKDAIKKYYDDNKEWFKALNAQRRLKMSLYKGNLRKIKSFYEEAVRLTQLTGISFHVDHIIPLNHKLICGLHHENNLQILTAFENTTKSNRFVPYSYKDEP